MKKKKMLRIRNFLTENSAFHRKKTNVHSCPEHVACVYVCSGQGCTLVSFLAKGTVLCKDEFFFLFFEKPSVLHLAHRRGFASY